VNQLPLTFSDLSHILENNCVQERGEYYVVEVILALLAALAALAVSDPTQL
jgi:hypothetical protein